MLGLSPTHVPVTSTLEDWPTDGDLSGIYHLLRPSRQGGKKLI